MRVAVLCGTFVSENKEIFVHPYLIMNAFKHGPEGGG
jgi:hypothetical protein